MAVPWPSSSCGDMDEAARTASAPKPSTNQSPATTLPLQVAGPQSSASAQTPPKPAGAGPRPGTEEKTGPSGSRPVSTRPMTTPCPPRVRAEGLSPAALASASSAAASGRTLLVSTMATPGVAPSRVAWSGVSSTATPLRAVVQR